MSSLGQSLSQPLLLGVLVYVALQVAIGLWIARRVRSEGDFILAGRRLGYPLMVFSLFATWFGAETCVGSAGAVYEGGLASVSADPLGYGLCLLLMGAVFAAPLWRAGLTTFADLFARRFGPDVERLAALLLIPTSVLWAAAQIRAFGQVLATCAPGLELGWAIVLATAVVLVYTASGGMLADAATDVIQGIALIAGLCVLLFVVVDSLGGWSAATARIEPRGLRMRPEGVGGLEWLNQWANPVFGSILATELISRVLAARSADVARRSSYIAGVLYLAIGAIPVYLGLLGASLLPDLGDAERVLPSLAQAHLHGAVYVLFAGALVSAILSTVDSALLVAGSLASHNLLLSLRPASDDRARLRAARIGVVSFGLVAAGLALGAESGLGLLEEANGFGSAGIVVSACFGLFTRWGGRLSAWAAIVTGTLVWLGAHHLLEHRADYLLSLLAALSAYVAVAGCEGRRSRGAPDGGACAPANAVAD